MSALADFQMAFADFLTARPGTEPPAALVGQIEDRAPGIQKRLAVYRNNVAMRFVEALADSYPAVLRLVGEEFFRFAALEYAAGHPAHCRALLHYGADFPNFLASFEPATSVPYLADVACLEWLYIESYHAPEADCLGAADAAGQTRFMLHPSARLMHSDHPVSRIWELNCSDAPVEGEIELPPGPEFLLVIRPEAEVEVRRLKRDTFELLADLSEGMTLEQMMERVPMSDILDLIEGGTFVAAKP